MLRSILRQIIKNWRGFLPIILVWIIGGYFIFQEKHHFLATLSSQFLSLPAPGEQEEPPAYDLVLEARELIEGGNQGLFCYFFSTDSCVRERKRARIRLDLMARACSQIPIKYRGNSDIYRPHWLEKLKTWNITSSSAQFTPSDSEVSDTVEPVEYWTTNKSTVLKALEKLIAATSYAFEISLTIKGKKEKSVLLLPELITVYSEALCMDDIALLVWGDYIEFIETRTLKSLKKKSPQFEREHIFPDDIELSVLKKLANNNLYIKALMAYSRGSPPEYGEGHICGRARYRLACIAPLEAIKIYNKLLYILPRARHAEYRLKLSQVYIMLSQKDNKKFLKKAMVHLSAALLNKRTSRIARMNMARIFLRQKNYSLALKQVKIMKKEGVVGNEYFNIVRATLIGLGRFSDADCFSRNAEMVYGMRTHCAKLQF